MATSETTSPHLLQYTSKEATLGIVESTCLWATSILYLNDADEFHHVRDLVANWIKRTRQDNSLEFPKDYRLLTGRQAVFVRFLERQLTGQRALHTYVVSFSALADDLSQWRAYGASGGFCLAFEPEWLKKVASKQHFELMECVYDDSEKNVLIEELMLEALADFAAVEAKISEDDLSAGLELYVDLEPGAVLYGLGEKFFLRAQQLACRIKNKAFHTEREWRLVSIKQPESDALNFRSNKSMLTPYLKLKLAYDGRPMKLSGLMAGPSPHASLNMLAAATLCKAKLLTDIKFSRTRLPYRDW